ncbi:MAG: hypothetical protein GY842_17675 [bacterium]|nr:hypothetical protein [bacterium]
MAEFVSESISPQPGRFDTQAMARGEPGLPQKFTWRDEVYAVVERIAQWKQSSREGSRAQGQLYLRRHYYKLRMSDESVWTVYFTRQAPAGSSPKSCWFLYEIDRSAPS